MVSAVKYVLAPIPALRFVLALLLITVLPFGPAHAEDLDAGVVKLMVTTHEGVQRVGSGFIVRLDSDWAYVVTAAHVVEGSRKVGLLFSGRRHAEPLVARVIHLQFWDKRGLALLRLAVPAARSAVGRPLPLSGARRLAKGEEVWVLGHPRVVADWSRLRGTVAGRQGETLKVQVNVDEGSSGGPVVREGKTVGIVVEEQAGFAIVKSVVNIRNYLEGLSVTAFAEAVPPVAPIRPEPEAPKGGESFRDCPNCPEMVVIQAGSFRMGSPRQEAGRHSDEGPMHTVRFDRPFAIARHEVTFDQWDACVRDGWCTHKPDDEGWGRGRRPVINVSWTDAQAYVSWLSQLTSKSYRLPSEAEWEYAARGGTRTARFWGDDPDTACRFANVYDNTLYVSADQLEENPFPYHECYDGYATTVSVGRFEENRFGLKDMLGNVWEWTQDCWNGSYAGAPGDGAAWTEGRCQRRVLRGGSWLDAPGSVRSANRTWNCTESRVNYVGFRPARTF